MTKTVALGLTDIARGGFSKIPLIAEDVRRGYVQLRREGKRLTIADTPMFASPSATSS